MVKEILRFFNLGSDPIPTPFEKKKKVEPTGNNVPDDIVHVRGQSFKPVEITDRHIEYDRWTQNELTRTDQLTSQDRQLIEEKGLLESKYVELKYLWSVYMTISQAVAECKKRGHKRGYGVSTIEKYFGAMSKAHATTPLAEKRGVAVNAP